MDKTAVIGAWDRNSNYVSTETVTSTDAKNPQGLVVNHTDTRQGLR